MSVVVIIPVPPERRTGQLSTDRHVRFRRFKTCFPATDPADSDDECGRFPMELREDGREGEAEAGQNGVFEG